MKKWFRNEPIKNGGRTCRVVYPSAGFSTVHPRSRIPSVNWIVPNKRAFREEIMLPSRLFFGMVSFEESETHTAKE